jgi:hypothetical protein
VPSGDLAKKEKTTMTLKQKLFFSLLFFLVFVAIAALIANGVAIYFYKPDMLLPYVLVLLIVTAANAGNLLSAFQRLPIRVPIPAPPGRMSR